MADLQTVASQFTQFYYSTFDSNRANLQSLYRDQSMLTWEDKQFAGVKDIISHMSSLPFQKVVHHVSKVDAQPSGPGSQNIIVLVTGLLAVDDSPNPMAFSEAFQLIAEGGSYYVLNDIFRLNLG